MPARVSSAPISPAVVVHTAGCAELNHALLRRKARDIGVADDISLTPAALGAAFTNRVTSEILDACQACSAYVEACPITMPGEVDTSAAPGTVRGVLDVLRGGEGTADSRRWRKSAPAAASAFRSKALKLTPATRIDLRGLLAELAEIRATGFAYDREEEHAPGVRPIGAPINVAGRRPHAISVAIPAHRFEAGLAAYRQALQDCRSQIEQNLSGASGVTQATAVGRG